MRLRRGPVWIIVCLATLSSLALGLAEAVVHPTQAQAGCINLIVNGDFENNSGWVSGASAVPPQYVTTQYHSPQRSLLLGIPTGYPNQQTYSSV
ncbi:MAG TPA: hypothetical protein VF806_07135, partial [Anaerolineaceae bacterium]